MHEITPAGGGDHFLPKNVKEKKKQNRENIPRLFEIVYSYLQPEVAIQRALVPTRDEIVINSRPWHE